MSNDYLGWNNVCMMKGHSWYQNHKLNAWKCSLCNKQIGGDKSNKLKPPVLEIYEDWGF